MKHFYTILSCLLFLSLQLTAQDLQVVALEFAAQQTRYQPFAGSITLTNSDASDVGNFSVTNLYLSTDQAYDASDTYFAFASFHQLAANSSQTFSISGSAVQFGINAAPGNYYLIAVADSRHEVTEKDEDNNTSVAPITILPASIDLSFSNTTKNADWAAQGDVITFSYSLSNLESETIKSVYTSFYLSEDPEFDPADRLWHKAYNAMNWQQSSTHTERITLPADAVHPYYYVFAKIEDHGQELRIEETDLQNNVVAFGSFKVVASSLDFSLGNIQAVAHDFRTLNVNFLVKNTGSTGVQGYGLRFYLSADQVLDNEDQFIITFPYHDHPSQYIGPSTSLSRMEYYSAREVREYLPAGDWYLIAHINYDEQVAELDYSNNYAVSSSRFSVPPYQVSVTTQEATFSSPPLVSDQRLDFTLSFNHVNHSGPFQFEVELLSPSGQPITSGRYYSYTSFNTPSFKQSISLQLPYPLTSGDYHLRISSDAGEPYEQLVQPAPFFHVQTLHQNNDELRFEWDSPHAATLSEYTLSLLHQDSESNYVLAGSGLSLKRKELAPGAYKWVVSALRNGEGFPSDTLTFELLPLSVTVKQLDISQQVMDYDELIKASFQLENVNYAGDFPYELLLTAADGSELGRAPYIIATLAQGSSAHQAQFGLSSSLKAGNYQLTLLSNYGEAFVAGFSVLPAVKEPALESTNRELSLSWASSFPEDVNEVSLRIYATTHDYDKTFSNLNSNQLVLARSELAAGKYEWYVMAQTNQKTLYSSTFSFNIEEPLAIGEHLQKADVAVYPNPANEVLHISANGPEASEAILMNLQGSIVRRISLSATVIVHSMETEALSEGLYVLVLLDKHKQRSGSRKVVIQKK